jgi:hypothetical protein
MPRPPRTASTPSTSSFSAKNATRSAAIAAFPSKSVGTIAPTACSKCPARACAQRKTGAHIQTKSLCCFARDVDERFFSSPADAHAIASCVRIVETRFLWCLQTPRTWMTVDPLAPISVRSASHPFSSTAVSADGTRPRSTSRSKSPPASRVRFFFARSRLSRFLHCGRYLLNCYPPSQLSCKSLRTRRPSRLNSSVLKSTLSPSYVHPLPRPPTSPATHTQRTPTLRRSTPSQPRRRLRWRVIFQASESTPLLRAAGATRARGMRSPSIAVALRLRAQRRALMWTSCGGWRKCRRWRRSASDGRTAGRRRYDPGICASLAY